MFEQEILFRAPEDSYITHRIPSIVCTPNGVVLAFVESRRPGENTDWTSNDFRLRRSFDGGRTWSPAEVFLASEKYGGGALHNLCLIADPMEKCVHALFPTATPVRFIRAPTTTERRGFLPSKSRKSFQPGVSPVPSMRVPRVSGMVFNFDQSGRLLVPAWIAVIPPPYHDPSRAGMLYSDDHGRTWKAGGLIPNTIPSCNEAQAVQLDDGSVFLNLRNMGPARRRAFSFSADGVWDWTEPRYEPALLDPQCHASMIYYRPKEEKGPGRIIYCGVGVLEPYHDKPTWIHYRRQILTLRVSEDEGKTWPIWRRLTTDSDDYAGYSDLAVLPDGSILCFYECGGDNSISAHCNTTMVMARFDLDWLLGRAKF